MSERPNILLIVVDQWRWDCLGSAGHPVVQTPHLDVLAAQGTRFSAAYSAVPSCIAARASLLTGMHQCQHGRVGYQDKIPWNYPATIGSVFSQAGYHTQAVGKMHVYPARNLVGFHNVVLHDGYLHWNRRREPNLLADDDYLMDIKNRYGIHADYIDSGLGCNGYAVAPWPYDIMSHPTAWVTTQSIDFLRRRDPTKPFLLMTSFHRPHPPLDPPRDYFHIYRDIQLPPIARGNWDGEAGLPNVYLRNRFLDSPKNLDHNQIDRARRAYYAQCTFIDHQINRLIMALIEHGVYDQTLILFVSDHGDMLFDHEIEAKSLGYQGSAAIPLIIQPPSGWNYPCGHIVDAPVELRDILPTLCDLCNIESPVSVNGISMKPLLEAKPVTWRDYIHGEHTAGDWSNHWLTNGRIKYIWYSQTGKEQVFNLEQDPYECVDLSESEPHLKNSWRKLMIDELQAREEGFVRDGDLITGRPVRSILSNSDASMAAKE